MQTDARIVGPPTVFIQTVGGMSDLKGLLNVHRILHAWMAELVSPSSSTRIGKGWTPDLVKAAHDLVVKRIYVLNPDFDHDSPIGAAAIPAGEPIMLIPDYVSVVGSTLDGKDGADLDIVVRDDGPKNESLEIRLAQMFGKDINLIYNSQGPHGLESKPVCHLALIPVSVWDDLTHKASAISAGMEAYRSVLKQKLHNPAYRQRIIVGSGLLRQRLCASMSTPAAVSEGFAAASWVINGGMEYPALPSDRDAILAAMDLDELYKTAAKVYRDLTGEITDFDQYTEILRKMYKQIIKWGDEKTFKDADEALDAARELGAKYARKET